MSAKRAGMTLDVVELPEDVGQELVIKHIQREGADAVLVQLPLSDALSTEAVLDAIPLHLDADILSSRAYRAFETGEESALMPPVVGAVREIFQKYNIDPKGRRAVVVGQGRLVGVPVHAWLLREGAHIDVVTKESGGLSVLKEADIVISGAGSAGLILPEHLSDGVILIDAGTSESGGQLAGDMDPACADKAALFTPVPGGVGPIAVACLFKNAAELARRNLQ
jgi:methylenetetrahydrofolate dehydrogenase (NADP+) / methenyltetrahydrofolate cyclohydrolase